MQPLRELKEARAEIEAWKSTSEADKAELKSAQKKIEHQIEALRGAHAIANGLENEKFELMKRNDQLIPPDWAGEAENGGGAREV